MVRRDVQPDRDIGAKGLQQFELVGRQFENVDAAFAQRREIESAATDIAADFAAQAGVLKNVTDQRRRRRLAVGAGDRHELRFRLGPRQQLHVADDGFAGGARGHGRRMRLGQAVGNAGAHHQRGDVRPVDGRRFGDTGARPRRLVARRRVVIPGGAVDPGRRQGTNGRQAGAREPQHDERRTLEDGEIDHPLTSA